MDLYPVFIDTTIESFVMRINLRGNLNWKSDLYLVNEVHYILCREKI